MQRNFVADFLREKPISEKLSLCVFEAPLIGGFRGNYAVHLRLIGKLIVDFLLVIIELF